MLGADDVRHAARFLEGQVVRTPALHLDVLDRIAGVELWLKAENLQHIGAFKARGALHCVGRLADAERKKGVITYSSGNHAQAVALAALRYGVPADIAMPEDAPAVKVEAVKAMGANVVFAGFTSDDRKKVAHEIQATTGGVIIPPFDHAHIVAGAGTATLELVEQVAASTNGGRLDALLVPVGGGGLIAGACLVAAEAGIPVYAVEPATCDAMAQSLEAGERVAVQPGPTLADGLKPVMVGELNFAIAKEHVTGCFRVDDEALGRTLATLAAYAKVIVEPSGAAAASVALGRRLPGSPKRIGAILSGGNLGLDGLTAILAAHRPHDRPSVASV